MDVEVLVLFSLPGPEEPPSSFLPASLHEWLPFRKVSSITFLTSPQSSLAAPKWQIILAHRQELSDYQRELTMRIEGAICQLKAIVTS